jgi:hypothetical protein
VFVDRLGPVTVAHESDESFGNRLEVIVLTELRSGSQELQVPRRKELVSISHREKKSTQATILVQTSTRVLGEPVWCQRCLAKPAAECVLRLLYWGWHLPVGGRSHRKK